MLFPQVFWAFIHGFSRNKNAEFIESLSCSLVTISKFTCEWFTNHSNYHIHIFPLITRTCSLCCKLFFPLSGPRKALGRNPGKWIRITKFHSPVRPRSRGKFSESTIFVVFVFFLVSGVGPGREILYLFPIFRGFPPWRLPGPSKGETTRNPSAEAPYLAAMVAEEGPFGSRTWGEEEEEEEEEEGEAPPG